MQVLRDGDIILADSSVICAYLEKAYPSSALLSQKPHDYAQALWFEEYADTELANIIVFSIFRHTIVLPYFFKETGNTTLITQTLNNDIPKCFDYLEKNLSMGQTYLVGNEYSLADIAITSCMVNFYLSGYSVDKERWPNFANYLMGHFDKPVLKKLIAEDNRVIELAK